MQILIVVADHMLLSTITLTLYQVAQPFDFFHMVVIIPLNLSASTLYTDMYLINILYLITTDMALESEAENHRYSWYAYQQIMRSSLELCSTLGLGPQ